MRYHLLQGFWNLLSFLPFCVMYILSDILFYPLYYWIRYRRKVVRKNLIESFPKKNLSEIKKIEKQFYHFFIDTIFETCKMASISKDEMRKRMKFENIEAAETILNQGKSISTYIGHYGNWEWISSFPLNLSQDITVIQIYQKLKNEAVDQLYLHNRERLGAIAVEKKQIARKINDLIDNKKVSIIGFIADQAPAREDIRHYVPFLHHNTPALIGTERLIKRYGFEAWYLDIKRLKRGYYEAKLIRMHENAQSLPDFELTDLYYKHLEQTILRQPELYLWTHKRFKHAQKIDI